MRGAGPLGFVAILGVLALIGILIGNSVILIVQIIMQIEEHRREGWDPRDAWSMPAPTAHGRSCWRPWRRACPHPDLPRGVLGTDGYAMMGGIIVGTLLTLVFLPALYLAWFRIKAPFQPKMEPVPTEEAHEPA
jgi:hypothetical protein